MKLKSAHRRCHPCFTWFKHALWTTAFCGRAPDDGRSRNALGWHGSSSRWRLRRRVPPHARAVHAGARDVRTDAAMVRTILATATARGSLRLSLFAERVRTTRGAGGLSAVDRRQPVPAGLVAGSTDGRWVSPREPRDSGAAPREPRDTGAAPRGRCRRTRGSWGAEERQTKAVRR